MLDRLPIYIQPVSFSERGKRLSGVLEISELARLSDVLQDTEGLVAIELFFDKEERIAVVNGHIKASLTFECQACLTPVTLLIDKNFKLGFVSSLEQADKLTSDCDPFILEDGRVALIELIEDEVLLALPDFPRHDHDCVERKEDSVEIEDTVDDGKQTRSNNPFSILAKLKNTGE
jgi:uncharacterized protein